MGQVKIMSFFHLLTICHLGGGRDPLADERLEITMRSETGVLRLLELYYFFHLYFDKRLNQQF